MNKRLLFILLLSSIFSFSQKKVSKELIFGEWEFIMMVDNDEKEVKSISMKGRFSWEQKKISGPNLHFKKDETCIKTFSDEKSISRWSLKNDKLIFLKSKDFNTGKKFNKRFKQEILKLSSDTLLLSSSVKTFTKLNFLYKRKK